MKASELRIGNKCLRENYLFNRYDEDKFHEITVDARDIMACSISPKKFEPIPLTEEWLIKLGFYDDKKIGYVGDDFVNGLMTVKIGEHHIKIKYVHQLQNLYFALTNEELTIN